MSCVDCGRSSKEVTINGLLCLKCYYKRRGRSPSHFPASYYVGYKGKRVLAPYQLRVGVCRICGKVGKRDGRLRTESHHYEYDNEEPYANTVEVCVQCHRKITSGKLELIKALIPLISIPFKYQTKPVSA